MLSSNREVIRALLTYTDWWQPATTSILQGTRRRGGEHADGMRAGLLEHIDERSELCRRMDHLKHVERHVLYLWYLEQLAAEDIARRAGISRRHTFRVRSNAIRKIVELGEDEAA